MTASTVASRSLAAAAEEDGLVQCEPALGNEPAD